MTTPDTKEGRDEVAQERNRFRRRPVVHDVVKEGGKVTEDTLDWYAQDRLGNVWYLGERSKELHDGHVDTSGSWQAGVNGGQAGIVMPAHPVVGRSYAQEFEPGAAEDQAKVIALDELKYYAQGVAMEIQTSPRFARSVLGEDDEAVLHGTVVRRHEPTATQEVGTTDG